MMEMIALMNDVRIWYDPMISIALEKGLSERAICDRTGIARRIISKLKLHTAKEMIPEGVASKSILDEYYPSLKTYMMLSFCFNCPMDALVNVADPFQPTKIITVAEAREKFNQIY